MPYVDGFVLAVPKRKIEAYRKMARMAGKVWKEHGALEFRECVADDLMTKGRFTFPKSVGMKPNETIFFSYIVYKSRAHRDRVNAKVMKDRRITSLDMKSMPMDPKRMLWSGFKVLVDL